MREGGKQFFWRSRVSAEIGGGESCGDGQARCEESRDASCCGSLDPGIGNCREAQNLARSYVEISVILDRVVVIRAYNRDILVDIWRDDRRDPDGICFLLARAVRKTPDSFG